MLEKERRRLLSHRPANDFEEHDTETISLPRPLKQKIKDAVVAVSLSNLCFNWAWFSLLYDQDYGYFNRLQVKVPTLLALMVNILGLASVIWLAMCLRRRFPNRALRLVLHLAFLALLLVPLDFCRSQAQIPTYQVVTFLKQPVVMVGALAFLALILWQHQVAVRVAAVLVAMLSPLAFFTLSKTVLLCFNIIHLSQHSGDHALLPLVPVSGDHPRVVWIIFDCTDYRLAFEQRPAGVSLPEFDRLRNESLFCVNACSPGNCTFSSMPELISGRQFLKAGIANSSDLNCIACRHETENHLEPPAVGVCRSAAVGGKHRPDRLVPPL